MNTLTLRKTIFVAFFFHAAFFSIFSVSSGVKALKPDYAGISFLGKVISQQELSFKAAAPVDLKKAFFKKQYTRALSRTLGDIPVTSFYLKPQAGPGFNISKRTSPVVEQALKIPPRRARQTVVMFHPGLPYHFLLYFKDRQAVHVELMFNVAARGNSSFITVRRKISSGNLEADLLTARYLSHYLFVQQAGFPSGSWQTVKIELSPKND